MGKEMFDKINQMEAKLRTAKDINDIRKILKNVIEMQILMSRMLKILPDIIMNPDDYREDVLDNIGGD